MTTDVVDMVRSSPEAMRSIGEVMAGRCGCGCGEPLAPFPEDVIRGEEAAYFQELREKWPRWQKAIAKKWKQWEDVTGKGIADLYQTHGIPAEVVEFHFGRAMTGSILAEYLAAWREHRKISGG